MFFHPTMLLALGSLAVPVAIHLLGRTRDVVVAWAAMRFLHVADAATRRRVRLRDLLLLLARCAAVAAVVVAAAGPTLGTGAVAAGPVTAVIVVDDSAAMTGTDGVADRFARAKAAAARRFAALPAGSSVAVLMASDTVAPLIATPTRDLSLARRLLADAAITDRPSDLLPAVRAACDLLRPMSGAKQVAVFTGGQRSAWAQARDIAAVLRAAPGVSATVVLVGPAVHANVAVTDLRPGGDLTPAGRPLRFTATVANLGDAAVTNLPVRLTVDANANPVAESTVPELPPGESRTVALYARLPTPGPHAATASVPPDPLPADDRRTIVVHAVDHLRVLLVGTDAGFLRAALQPVPADQRGDYVVQVTAAAGVPSSLDGYAAVVVAGDVPVSPALAAYVRAGGGLIVFPAAPTSDPLLPATVGPPTGDADHPVPLSAGPFDHPIAALWNDAGNGSPAAAHVSHAFALTPAAGGRVVLSMANGRPFAVERGRAIVFAVPADTAASDLPLHGGLFVPLVRRCLAAVTADDAPLNVPVGQPLLAPAPVADVGRPVAVQTPAGPADTTVTLAPDGSAGYRIDATDRAGTYTAAVGTRTDRFAAQMNPAATRLDEWTPADRAAVSAVATVIDGAAGAEVHPGSAGRGALIVPLLLLAVALAAVDPLLANGTARRKL